MDIKPGWKTTEFWITALVVVSTLLGWLAGHIPGEYAAIVEAAAAAAYAASRALAKKGGRNADVRAQVLEVLTALRRGGGNGVSKHPAAGGGKPSSGTGT